MISMREVFNLFSFDSVVQVKRSCLLTCTTESKENKLKTSLIEIMLLLFNHLIHEINKLKMTTCNQLCGRDVREGGWGNADVRNILGIFHKIRYKS